mmetsp:Transcript_20445/g.63398  ORF Transcript_20445/g.63398 Transcript_20445/m.63398 type:complete len:244 (-) Transcript_20445:481-1212(-)
MRSSFLSSRMRRSSNVPCSLMARRWSSKASSSSICSATASAAASCCALMRGRKGSSARWAAAACLRSTYCRAASGLVCPEARCRARLVICCCRKRCRSTRYRCRTASFALAFSSMSPLTRILVGGLATRLNAAHAGPSRSESSCPQHLAAMARSACVLSSVSRERRGPLSEGSASEGSPSSEAVPAATSAAVGPRLALAMASFAAATSALETGARLSSGCSQKRRSRPKEHAGPFCVLAMAGL